MRDLTARVPATDGRAGTRVELNGVAAVGFGVEASPKGRFAWAKTPWALAFTRRDPSPGRVYRTSRFQITWLGVAPV